MRIGMTYDLKTVYLSEGHDEEEVAEFDSEETIDAIEGVLKGLGHEVVRVGHVKDLVRELTEGRSWDLVFNIAEGLHGLGREAQVPGVLDAFGIPYTFGDPLTMALTLDKSMAKRVVRDAGLPTTSFKVIHSLADIKQIDFPYPVFIKPLAEGTSKGISKDSKAGNEMILEQIARFLLKKGKPLIVEPYLPGREFTVGILGTGQNAHALGIMEVVMRTSAMDAHNSYSYDVKENYLDLVDYILPTDIIAQKAVEYSQAIWRLVRGRDGGRVDFRCDANGEPQFLEVNPLPGLHPVKSDLPILGRLVGMDYKAIVTAIFDSALERMAMPQRKSPFESRRIPEHDENLP